jgi:hypothetical protein
VDKSSRTLDEAIKDAATGINVKKLCGVSVEAAASSAAAVHNKEPVVHVSKTGKGKYFRFDSSDEEATDEVARQVWVKQPPAAKRFVHTPTGPRWRGAAQRKIS